jgi:TolB-like protein
MKTLIKIIFSAALLMLVKNANAQTIVVAPIKSYGLLASSYTVTKLTQLELVKLNKYAVLDQFDKNELEEIERFDSCFGKTCLVDYGKALKTDFVLSGNVDGLGNKIVVNLKMIDVKSGQISRNKSMEFDNQEIELQRMIGIVLGEMHDLVTDPELLKRLMFNNEVIVSNNVGRINNSGPRMGVAYTIGSVNEFVTRPEAQGGLEIAPVVSNIGYQFEGQYVGTENFSALVEGLFMFSGLEQGKFIPSFSLLNGYRFGKSGWEFAFGPTFSLSKTTLGYFDESGKYWSKADMWAAGEELDETKYAYTKQMDTRGDVVLSTRWLMAFGRTFRTGALNIPVNVFYSSQKGGGMIGCSVGFNVIRSKKTINQ